jgi:Na+-transporting NADH:ubiquinone oxidoreductase subunit C
MKKDNPVYVVVFTFIICILFVSGLTLANELTKERVAANRRFAGQSAVLSALGLAYADQAEAERLFNAEVTAIVDTNGDILQPPAWRSVQTGRDVIISQYGGAGLWGGITIILAADPATATIRGLRIIDQNETPGLGGRITETWFQEQFRNLSTANGRVAISSGAESGGTASPAGTVDGITGATRTSDAMVPIINGALERIRAIADGSALVPSQNGDK